MLESGREEGRQPPWMVSDELWARSSRSRRLRSRSVADDSAVRGHGRQAQVAVLVLPTVQIITFVYSGNNC